MKDYGKYSKESIIDNLLKVDNRIALEYPELIGKLDICIAGSLWSIFYIDDYRKTNDIDIIKINYPIDNLLLQEFDMNTDIQVISDFNIPMSYLDRIKPLDIETIAINYFIISLEDYVIMKLMAYREKDKIDINKESIVKNINWNLLEKLADEMNDVFLNDRLKTEFIYVFNEYKERWKKWGQKVLELSYMNIWKSYRL